MLNALGSVADVSILVVFLAGMASFLSPCVLPLLPGYLSYVSGTSIESISSGQAKANRLLGPTVIFVLGFTTVFVALGVTASVLGSYLITNGKVIRIVAGTLVAFMGLVFMDIIKFPWLYSEKRFQSRPGTGVARNYLMGLAFGFGWTPCIGPTLGATFALAATQQSAGRGALLLAVYSLGLGVPFVLAALGVSKLTGTLSWFKRRQMLIMLVAGDLLFMFGLLLAFDQVFVISSLIQRAMDALGLTSLARI
ncbi:MAG: cytochrome c biogenesis protein CcdA [Actinomycetota bacterium]